MYLMKHKDVVCTSEILHSVYIGSDGWSASMYTGVLDEVQVSAPGVLDEVLVVCTVRALAEE